MRVHQRLMTIGVLMGLALSTACGDGRDDGAQQDQMTSPIMGLPSGDMPGLPMPPAYSPPGMPMPPPDSMPEMPMLPGYSLPEY